MSQTAEGILHFKAFCGGHVPQGDTTSPELPQRLRKADRQAQILSELKLRPHVRIGDMARRFGVSSETIRRDLDALGQDGRLSREHGGASSSSFANLPGYGERSRERTVEREAIGRAAAGLVRDGQRIMIDSGSTTFQMARALVLAGTRCTVVTNSLEIALTLGTSKVVEVFQCPGQLLPSEAATTGIDTVDYLKGFRVDACFIGASALNVHGIQETVPGFADIKKAMITCARQAHLLVDSQKFDLPGFRHACDLVSLDTVVVDRRPQNALAEELEAAEVSVLVAA